MRTSITRQKVAAGLRYNFASLKDDVLDIDAGLNTNIIQVLLDAERIGIQGITLTSGRKDRQRPEDKAMGPRGHAFGKSLDLWANDVVGLANFLCAHPLVTVVGLGGDAQLLIGQIRGQGKLFYDNWQTHLHFQVA